MGTQECLIPSRLRMGRKIRLLAQRAVTSQPRASEGRAPPWGTIPKAQQPWKGVTNCGRVEESAKLFRPYALHTASPLIPTNPPPHQMQSQAVSIASTHTLNSALSVCARLRRGEQTMNTPASIRTLIPGSGTLAT